MKDYLTALQSIDRDAWKAKAQVARELAGEYARQAKEAAGAYARQAKSSAGSYVRQAGTAAGKYAQDAKAFAADAAAAHAPQAEAFAENARAAVRGFAEDARSDACDLCNFTAEQVRGFSLFDLAVFKFVLISFGMWLGARLAAKCARLTEKLRPLFFAAFLCGYVYLIYRIFFRDRE